LRMVAMFTRPDSQLLSVIKEKLYVAVVSDVLDELGYRNQALPPRIRPLDDTLVMVGFARTGLYRDVYHIRSDENPYELEMALVDDLQPDEIPVLGCGASGRIAPWGELLSTAARMRGATGCVTDGLVRDTRIIRKMGFPVFHGGIGPLDSKGRGKVADIDVPVQCAGVRVETRDLVFGDADGVIVVPQAVEAEALSRALAKVEGENETRLALERGEKLRDVFARHGIL
jgi:4-hydroxy-4-methyl-2-oxoglutarate aldolase